MQKAPTTFSTNLLSLLCLVEVSLRSCLGLFFWFRSGSLFIYHVLLLFIESKVLPQLTNWKLNGSNFLQWSKAINVAIIDLGHEVHITESAPTTDDEAIQQRRQMDAQRVAL